MEFQTVLPVFLLVTLLSLKSSAQSRKPYPAVPYNCSKNCNLLGGYQMMFEQPQCRCKSELCKLRRKCGPQERCVVEYVWRVELPTCVKIPGAVVPSPQPLAATETTKPASVRCAEPLIMGRCRALMERFYFDSTENVCKKFGYGGCDGNDNNFYSMEECQKTCQSATSTVQSNDNTFPDNGYSGFNTFDTLSALLIRLRSGSPMTGK